MKRYFIRTHIDAIKHEIPGDGFLGKGMSGDVDCHGPSFYFGSRWVHVYYIIKSFGPHA